MPLTTLADQAVLNGIFQAAVLGEPATGYVGLLTAPTWLASTAYTAGEYVVPTTFGTLTGSVGRIFKCTTAGTSAATAPTWPTTAGGTVVDGTVTWTEVTLLFEQGTFTGAEMSTGGYARVAVVANVTNWASASAAQPSVTQNAVAVDFASPTSTWPQCVGFIYATALTAGSIWVWGCVVGSAIVAGTGSNPSFAIDAMQITLE